MNNIRNDQNKVDDQPLVSVIVTVHFISGGDNSQVCSSNKFHHIWVHEYGGDSFSIEVQVMQNELVLSYFFNPVFIHCLI